MTNRFFGRFRKQTIPFISFLGVAVFAVAAIGDQETVVQTTPFSMDIYGFIDGVEKGDVLTVYDPDGVLCGKYVVDKPGQYGFLHIYGDDPATEADEGPVAGDILAVELNGQEISPLSGELLRWKGDRSRERVDLSD